MSSSLKVPSLITGLPTANGIEGSSGLTILYSTMLPSDLFPGGNPGAEPCIYQFLNVCKGGRGSKYPKKCVRHTSRVLYFTTNIDEQLPQELMAREKVNGEKSPTKRKLTLI